MTRPLRIEFPGAIYHVISRGNDARVIYNDNKDRMIFLEILSSAMQRYHWLCHAYCLMTNHYHLLVETPEGNLSAGMRQINGVYTRRFNVRHRKTGHLFQGRFKSILVERDPYLLEVNRYISLNPVRAGLVTDPAKYRWSSFAAMIGKCTSPSFLNRDWILAQFDPIEEIAIKKYREFVYEGISQENRTEAQSILGKPEFKANLKGLLDKSTRLKEFPREQRFANRPTLQDIFSVKTSKPARNTLIRDCILIHGYTLTEVGKHLHLHYTTISKIANRKN